MCTYPIICRIGNNQRGVACVVDCLQALSKVGTVEVAHDRGVAYHWPPNGTHFRLPNEKGGRIGLARSLSTS
jgi:hypothetical protein